MATKKTKTTQDDKTTPPAEVEVRQDEIDAAQSEPRKPLVKRDADVVPAQVDDSADDDRSGLIGTIDPRKAEEEVREDELRAARGEERIPYAGLAGARPRGAADVHSEDVQEEHDKLENRMPVVRNPELSDADRESMKARDAGKVNRVVDPELQEDPREYVKLANQPPSVNEGVVTHYNEVPLLVSHKFDEDTVIDGKMYEAGVAYDVRPDMI